MELVRWSLLLKFQREGWLNKTLKNAKNKVIKVLQNEPFGLSVSQLMTVSRLSAKTVKTILKCAEFEVKMMFVFWHQEGIGGEIKEKFVFG